MTITSLKSELCCGCAVCYDRCPVNAIGRTQKAILLLSLMLHYVLIVVSVPKSAHR